jgi:hypothetical protein
MRKRRVGARRVALSVGIAALLVAGWAVVPRLAARLAIFRLRQIELVGVRRLAPETVIAALRLPPEASVFADTRLLADRVRGVPGVADVHVGRLLPGTLRVRVTEVEPTAFVAAGPHGRLVPVDPKGEALPFAPGRPLDVPIAASADSGLIGVLALVQSVDPTLFAQVTGARMLEEGDVALELGTRDVLLRCDAAAADVVAVELVARDLAARGRRYAELDARIAGQVVVRNRASRARDGRERDVPRV